MPFNLLKPLIKKIQDLFFCKLSKQALRNDEELECLQFGICTVEASSPRPEELFFR